MTTYHAWNEQKMTIFRRKPYQMETKKLVFQGRKNFKVWFSAPQLLRGGYSLWDVYCTSRNSGTMKISLRIHLGVSENSGTPKSPILIGFSIVNHPFWGTPIFGNTHFRPAVFPTKIPCAVHPCVQDASSSPGRLRSLPFQQRCIHDGFLGGSM